MHAMAAQISTENVQLPDELTKGFQATTLQRTLNPIFSVIVESIRIKINQGKRFRKDVHYYKCEIAKTQNKQLASNISE